MPLGNWLISALEFLIEVALLKSFPWHFYQPLDFVNQSWYCSLYDKLMEAIFLFLLKWGWKKKKKTKKETWGITLLFWWRSLPGRRYYLHWSRVLFTSAMYIFFNEIMFLGESWLHFLVGTAFPWYLCGIVVPSDGKFRCLSMFPFTWIHGFSWLLAENPVVRCKVLRIVTVCLKILWFSIKFSVLLHKHVFDVC